MKKPKTFNPYKATKEQRNRQAQRRQERRAYKTNSKQWRAIRAQVLAESPTCEHCWEHQGIVRAATEVDHIDGDAMNNDPENLQALCKPCHSRKTASESISFA